MNDEAIKDDLDITDGWVDVLPTDAMMNRFLLATTMGAGLVQILHAAKKPEDAQAVSDAFLKLHAEVGLSPEAALDSAMIILSGGYGLLFAGKQYDQIIALALAMALNSDMKPISFRPVTEQN